MVQFSWSIVKWKNLETVRAMKFCLKQHSDRVPEKTRCFMSEGWHYWHFKANFPWRATSYWQFWKGFLVLSWCYLPTDWPPQYQCGQPWKHTQANDCPTSLWERTWQNWTPSLTLPYRNHCWSYTRRGRNHHW